MLERAQIAGEISRSAFELELLANLLSEFFDGLYRDVEQISDLL